MRVMAKGGPMTRPFHTSRLALAAFLVLASAIPALAGPPLICHEFQTSGHPSLPWGDGSGWNTPLEGYDVSGLADDTVRLLAPDVPVPARMETLRRATIYAARDPEVARRLLSILVARVREAEGTGSEALALFDAGYLVESYRQATRVFRWDMLSRNDRSSWTLREEPAGLDGYRWVRRALDLNGGSAEMEYAASLMRPASQREPGRNLGH
jgi:hypothetical protein